MQRALSIATRPGARALDKATVQRYKTIRTFFKKAAAQHASASNCATRLVDVKGSDCVRVDTARWPLIARKTLAIRAFATSTTRFDANKPSSSQVKRPGESREQECKEEGTPVVKDGQQPISSHHLENYSRFFRRLALSLPPMQRPTRDDFLKVATSFWQRLRIRFKWFTIKSFRKFDADDMSAFFTWFLMSQTLWILVGT